MATSLAGGCDGSGHGLRMEMLVRISSGPSKHTGLGVDVSGRGAVEEHGCLLFLPPSTFPLTRYHPERDFLSAPPLVYIPSSDPCMLIFSLFHASWQREKSFKA